MQLKKETLTQVFSYEFCEIFTNTFFAKPFLLLLNIDVKYNQWQNIMGILKTAFKIPPLPLCNVANP